jgi:hypothetical protein
LGYHRDRREHFGSFAHKGPPFGPKSGHGLEKADQKFAIFTGASFHATKAVGCFSDGMPMREFNLFLFEHMPLWFSADEDMRHQTVKDAP